MSTFIIRLLKSRKAATAVEYGLIVSLIVIAAMVAINQMSNTTVTIWNNVSEEFVNHS